ncbi:oligosaccharide 4-alpha-D-glucosyltransferase [Abditibacteriota bacterium]|nr:oligosaccharide 4-alpha-D-glucosyltransferase [Abditibacteriota bacterium]
MNRSFTPHKGLLLTTTALAFFSACANVSAAPQNPIVVGGARFSVLTPNCIRIEYARDGKFVDLPSLFAINRQTRFDGFKLEKSANSTVIDTGAIRLRYSHDGQPLSPANLSATIEGGARWTPGARSSGNLGGTTRTLDGVRGPVDVGQGVLSRDGWYLLDDSNDLLLTGDWVQARPKTAGQDWYLFGYGSNYRAALKSLTAVGGDVPLPRKNLLGTWFSRYWAFSSTDYRNIVQEYRQHDFPLDNIVLDMDWHRDGWTGWSWNRKLLPDAEKLLSDFHADGLQTTLNLHPADGVAPHEDQYAAFMKTLDQPADGKTVSFDAGSQKYMNALSSEVLAPLRKNGVDFWWLDWQQYPNTRSIPELTNLWWLNELLYRDTAQDGRRGVSFSRWAGWGDHRHPIHFSGDADAGWRMLAFEVPYTSTAGNVGCFFWSHDIGGHNGGRNEESYTRWCQFGALSAALRSHSSRDASTDRRPWNYPDWAEKSMRVSFHLRSQLFPYIYTSVAQSSRDSVPLTRPLYFDYPKEEAAYHNGQEYLLGDNLLVAPIAMPGIGPSRVAHQTVWFPTGSDWFNTFTGEKFAGGSQALCSADINEIPLFARGGVPIPMQPYSERMTTAPLSTLRVRVFPGADGGTGRSSLYEDDGSTDAYKKGVSTTTPLTYTRRGNRVDITVGAATGKFGGQLATRAVQIELPGTKRAGSVTLEGKALAVTYDAVTATNTIAVPTRSTAKAFTVSIEVADADFDALHNLASARRMTGVTGRDFTPQAPRDLVKNALSVALTPAERDEALAVVGVGMVRKSQSPTFALGDVRDVFFAPPGVLDGEARVETVSRSTASFQIGGKTVHFPEIFGADDIASDATVTVSGVEDGYGFAGASDKTLGGYPGDRGAEWSANQKEGATIRLTWKTPQKINRIALYDRPNTNDNVLRSQLTFSDGTTLEVGTLPNEGDTPYEVRFPDKTVEWVEWKALSMSDASEHAGLSEIAVYRAP